MKTCCSINCPFIPFCKDYNFTIDRKDGCETQSLILQRAEKLKKQQENLKKVGAVNE